MRNINNIVLITGCTGQTGSYLSELLIKKDFDVHGIVRRGSTINTSRIDHLLNKDNFELHYGDLADANSLLNIIKKLKPDYIYNIGSMSHVRVSFEIPEYTMQVTGLGALRILEILRSLNMKSTSFLQASSSEMYGLSHAPQNENTPMLPVSPYGVAKLSAYYFTKLYRSGYNIFACNSICFNHESERRGERFVTKKIVRAACRIKLGLQDKLYLGNLDAKRDWGHAKDYAYAQFLIMDHNEPDDFVVATEEYHSVKDFLYHVFDKLHLEIDDYVVIDNRLKRPNEVPELRGDASKIRDVLGWKPKVTYNQLIDMMIKDAMDEEKQNKYFKMQAEQKENLSD